MVDLDGFRPDGGALKDGQRALPVPDVTVRIKLGFKFIQPDLDRGPRNRTDLPFAERQVGLESAQAADEASGDDDQQAGVNDIRAQPSGRPFSRKYKDRVAFEKLFRR